MSDYNLQEKNKTPEGTSSNKESYAVLKTIEYIDVFDYSCDQIPESAHQLFVEAMRNEQTDNHIDRFSYIFDKLHKAGKVSLEETDYTSIEEFANEIGKEVIDKPVPNFYQIIAAVNSKAKFLKINNHDSESFINSFMSNWVGMEIEKGNIKKTEVEKIYNKTYRKRALAVWNNLTQLEKEERATHLNKVRINVLDRNSEDLSNKIREMLNSGMLFIDIAEVFNITSTAMRSYIIETELDYDKELVEKARSIRRGKGGIEKRWIPTLEQEFKLESNLELDGVSKLSNEFGIGESTLKRYLYLKQIDTPRTARYKRRLDYLNTTDWMQAWEQIQSGDINFAELYEQNIVAMENISIDRFEVLVREWAEDRGLRRNWVIENHNIGQWIIENNSLLSDSDLPKVLELINQGVKLTKVYKHFDNLKSSRPVISLLKRNEYSEEDIRRLDPIYNFKTTRFRTEILPLILSGEITQSDATKVISDILSEEKGREIKLSHSTVNLWVSNYKKEM